MGKLGALLGGFCFEPLAKAVGYGWLFVVCGCISIVAVLLTHFAVAPYGRDTFRSKSAQGSRGSDASTSLLLETGLSESDDSA
mgnify:FL=1